MTFGVFDPNLTARLIEVSPDAEGVWHLVLPKGYSSYRAERMEPRFGFVVE